MNESDDLTPDAAYLADIDYLKRMIETGAELVEEGNEISLANLEAAISDLCVRMAEHPPADSAPITDAIEELVERLGELGEALKRQHEATH